MHNPPALDLQTLNLLHAQAHTEALRLRQQALNDVGDALWRAAQHAAQRATGRGAGPRPDLMPKANSGQA